MKVSLSNTPVDELAASEADVSQRPFVRCSWCRHDEDNKRNIVPTVVQKSKLAKEKDIEPRVKKLGRVFKLYCRIHNPETEQSEH